MDSEQFKQTYYPFHEKLYRVAFRLLMDSQGSQDIVQEAYLKLWDKRHELEDIERPEAFAITTVQNLCLNLIRWKKDKITASYDYDIVEERSLEKEIESKDKAVYIKQLIEQLPEQQRQVMILRHYEDYSYEEIETLLGLDIRNIRVIVSRARKTLREQFEKTEKE